MGNSTDIFVLARDGGIKPSNDEVKIRSIASIHVWKKPEIPSSNFNGLAAAS